MVWWRAGSATGGPSSSSPMRLAPLPSRHHFWKGALLINPSLPSSCTKVISFLPSMTIPSAGHQSPPVRHVEGVLLGSHRCVRAGKWLPLRAADAWVPARAPCKVFQDYRIYLDGPATFRQQFGALLPHAGMLATQYLAAKPLLFTSLCIPALHVLLQTPPNRRSSWLLQVQQITCSTSV